MLKSEFIYHLQEVIFYSKYNYRNDKPAIRQLFNGTKDAMGKDGVITDSQVNNWILTDRELNKLSKTREVDIMAYVIYGTDNSKGVIQGNNIHEVCEAFIKNTDSYFLNNYSYKIERLY